jgi:20S proteasome alpha/beta subunit
MERNSGTLREQRRKDEGPLTVAISLNLSDGVVMAADSAITPNTGIASSGIWSNGVP